MAIFEQLAARLGLVRENGPVFAVLAPWRMDTIIAATLFWLSPFIVFVLNCELADAVEMQAKAFQFVAALSTSNFAPATVHPNAW